MSGKTLTLKAADGHEFTAYYNAPPAPSGMGLVVAQEIFGVNDHIRRVTDAYARDGFHAIAPALFDRAQADVELDYDANGVAMGRSLRTKVGYEGPMRDMLASVQWLQRQGAKKIGVIGYCWGGTIAFLSACRLDIDAAIDYYGTGTVDFLTEKPRCAIQMHFGERDSTLPPTALEKIKHAVPQAEIYLYPADHGFNCDARAQYDAAAAKTARDRSLDFLRKYLE